MTTDVDTSRVGHNDGSPSPPLTGYLQSPPQGNDSSRERGKLFSCILADPPWRYDEGFPGGPGHGDWTNEPLPYPSMSVQEIAALRVGELAAKDCRLWLWTTNRYLPHAFGVMARWGFNYKQCLVWHKLDANLGGSVAPNSCEFLLVGVRGNPRCNRRWKSALVALAHGARHSEKPKEYHFLIEQVDEGPRLEMFARRKRAGWSSWGNEIVPDIEIGNGAVAPADSGDNNRSELRWKHLP